jgi:hypothetical protein
MIKLEMLESNPGKFLSYEDRRDIKKSGFGYTHVLDVGQEVVWTVFREVLSLRS